MITVAQVNVLSPDDQQRRREVTCRCCWPISAATKMFKKQLPNLRSMRAILTDLWLHHALWRSRSADLEPLPKMVRTTDVCHGRTPADPALPDHVSLSQPFHVGSCAVSPLTYVNGEVIQWMGRPQLSRFPKCHKRRWCSWLGMVCDTYAQNHVVALRFKFSFPLKRVEINFNMSGKDDFKSVKNVAHIAVHRWLRTKFTLLAFSLNQPVSLRCSSFEILRGSRDPSPNR